MNVSQFSRCLFLFTPLGLLLASSTAARAETYDVSAGMSYVWFKVRHFGVSNAYGRFNDFSGTLSGDFGQGDMQFDFAVEAASIDTGIEDRDNHLRGPDFFNAREYPEITFQSTALQPIEGKEGHYELQGDLTLLGVTKPITAEFTYFGKGTGAKGKPIVGGEAVFTIQRTDFGMNYGAPDAIGDEVTITVAMQGSAAD